MLEGILFDMDGVIVNSEPLYYQTMYETFKLWDVDLNVDEFVKRWMLEQTNSMGVINDYKLSASIGEIRKVKAEKAKKLFDEKLELMPYSRELITELSTQYPLGIVSSSSRTEIIRNVERFDLVDKFSVLVGHEDYNYTKPHPEPYLTGAECLGLNPANIVVIEDNPAGITSAKQAGCKSIAYPNGFTKDLDFSHATAVVNGLNEINSSLLQSLF